MGGHRSTKYRRYPKFQDFSLLITYFYNKNTSESSDDIKKYLKKITEFDTKFCDVLCAVVAKQLGGWEIGAPPIIGVASIYS